MNQMVKCGHTYVSLQGMVLYSLCIWTYSVYAQLGIESIVGQRREASLVTTNMGRAISSGVSLFHLPHYKYLRV